MANFNKVILAGNLTRDPKLSYSPAQTAVCDFGMAVNRKWKGQDGVLKEESCFVDCRAFGRTAETLDQYMTKGKPILVEGRLSFSEWEEDGKRRSKLRVTVENFQFMGSAMAPAVGPAPRGEAKPAPAAVPDPMKLEADGDDF